MQQLPKLAIVGSGIAGISCAYYLSQDYDITVYEKDDYLGGHTNTVVVDENLDGENREVPIDTGFMVFNEKNYPNLVKLFQEIEVDSFETSMSLSIKDEENNFEYRGTNLLTIFGQKKNFFNPKFYWMLKEIYDFMKMAEKIEEYPIEMTLKEFVEKYKLSDYFLWYYLLPMTSAIWSCSPDEILGFPILSILCFLKNHGIISYPKNATWKTLRGGSQTYYKKIREKTSGRFLKNHKIVKVIPFKDKMEVVLENGTKEIYDKVIMACHADQSVKICSGLPKEDREILDKFKYHKNETYLHTDSKFLPQRKSLWASWNVMIDRKEVTPRFTISYYMNRLQQVSKRENYFVTLNPFESIDEKSIIKKIEYHHPIFDLEAVEAQSKLPSLNDGNQLFFTGSYFGYGFHEDALTASKKLCEKILSRPLA